MITAIIKKIKNPIGIAVFLLFISIVIIIFASRLLYEHTVNLLTENLRERILTISITAAANIDADDLDTLQVEDDWQKPGWARVVNKLHNAKYSNKDIVFMYIFRKNKDNPSMMEFIADADSINPYANSGTSTDAYIDVNRDGKFEPDGPDKLQWPGQEYPEAAEIPEAWEAYNGPLTSRELYTDAYGTVLTGYAPIMNASGTPIAILATDIKADDFFTITKETLQPFVIFIIFLTSIISILTIIIIYIWKRYTNSLEKLNRQIEDANNKLKELDQLKSEFLSLATHQIRAPLTAIQGYTSMLLEGDYGVLPEKAKSSVEVIFKSCRNLIRIVADFLNISRIEQGRMVYERTNFKIAEMLEEVVKEFEPNVRSAGLTIELDTKSNKVVEINADRDKMKQIVGNVVDNAV